MARPIPRFALAAALTALAALPAAARRDDKDPAFDGKPASAWVTTLREDPSARKRASAVDALARLWADKRHADGLSEIGRALRVDGSAAVRSQAAQALAGLRAEDIKAAAWAKDLVDAMGAEKESRVRREVAKAIARFPDLARLAATHLAAALKDPEPATRAAAAEALALAGADGKGAAGELAPLLADKDRAVRRAAVVALGRISPEGAATIAETMAGMLAAEKDDPELRTELVVSLGLLGEKSGAVVDALAGLLADPDEAFRRRAARTLGTFGPAARPAADALLKLAATDKLKDIRIDAVRGFGSAVAPDLKARVKDLLDLLDKEPEFEVRMAVIDEVGALGYELHDDKATIKTLRTRLSDPHVKVREAALAAIRKIEKKPEPKKEPEPKKDP
ncbi:MAG: hypothetical protein C0501_10005 [Isosphaera sp.]|nr:hypothetical protein [Isosphaera sp.]